jgi:hypothetical protein
VFNLVGAIKAAFETRLGRAVIHVLLYAACALIVNEGSRLVGLDVGAYTQALSLAVAFVIDTARKYMQENPIA